MKHRTFFLWKKGLLFNSLWSKPFISSKFIFVHRGCGKLQLRRLTPSLFIESYFNRSREHFATNSSCLVKGNAVATHQQGVEWKAFSSSDILRPPEVNMTPLYARFWVIMKYPGNIRFLETKNFAFSLSESFKRRSLPCPENSWNSNMESILQPVCCIKILIIVAGWKIFLFNDG